MNSSAAIEPIFKIIVNVDWFIAFFMLFTMPFCCDARHRQGKVRPGLVRRYPKIFVYAVAGYPTADSSDACWLV